MKYLGGFLDSDDLVRHWSTRSGRGLGPCKICDTECDSVETGDLSEFLGKDIIGIGTSAITRYGVAVVHTRKTAELYKHVGYAGTKHGTNFDRLGCNVCVIGGGVIQTVAGSYTMAVNMQGDVIHAGGYLGSCISTRVASQTTDKLHTLYDVLARLCKVTGVPLMAYKRLIFYSDTHGYKTTIRFADTVEARKYLAKMTWYIS